MGMDTQPWQGHEHRVPPASPCFSRASAGLEQGQALSISKHLHLELCSLHNGHILAARPRCHNLHHRGSLGICFLHLEAQDVGRDGSQCLPSYEVSSFFFFFLLQAKKIYSGCPQIVAIITAVCGHTGILWKPDVPFSNLCCRASGWPQKVHRT